VTDEQHLTWLKIRLAEYEAELAQATSVLARLTPLVEHLREVIAAFEAERTPEVQADSTAPSSAPTPSSNQINSRVSHSEQHSHMPPRRPEYHAMTAIAALTQVLGSQMRAFHADELARIIFDVRSAEQFHAAKRAVVSDLIRGAEKGLLEKLGGNQFGAKGFSMLNNTLPTSPMSPAVHALQEPSLENHHHLDQVDHQFPLEIAQQDNTSVQDSVDRRPLKPGTLKYQCYLLFKEVGLFMWPRELAERLSQKGITIDHPSPAELLGSILRKSIHRDQRLFGRNTEGKYGLLEWLGDGDVIYNLTRHDNSDTLESKDPPSVTWEGLE
jgi:hypothetical protein